MKAARSRKETKEYISHMANIDHSDCEFCKITKDNDKYGQYVEETDNFKITKNIFGYSFWDGLDVTDHLMVMPKSHIVSLADIPASQAAEFLKIIGKYEKAGYNIYARPPESIMKSIPHQHTHLIKTSGEPKKLVLALAKPYIRIIV